MTAARDIARRALAGIPGWSGARLSALTGGVTNTTWLVEQGGRRATLKADASRREFPFGDREDEAAIQRVAAAHDLANRVIFASPTALLCEFVDGTPWTSASLNDSRNLPSLARTLRRLHRLPGSGRRFDALRAARLYAERIEVAATAATAGIENHLGILESLPAPTELCLCHNDVVAGNLLATPELRLLDWEYACDNDPMFDLAIVIVHHALDTARSAHLLNAYAGDADDALHERLRREIRRYRSLAWLWQAASP